MRKFIMVALTVAVASTLATAQGKIHTKWHCEKPTTEQKLPVGDTPDHDYVIAQGECTATSSEKDFPEKSAQYTEFRETWKDSYKNHGRYNATLENGDVVYYTYEGKASMAGKEPASNTWKLVSATGTLKGATGSGTCTGKLNEDQSSDWECTGKYMKGK